MNKKKSNIANQYDILCSVWVLASMDENPLITYEGLKYRLELPETFNIHALVHSRSELFRKSTPQYMLDDWKKEMRQGKSLPSWIKKIKDEEERKNKIEGMSINDVFRSQFRIKLESPKSDIEIIKWGLDHIDRLRNVELETKREGTRFFTTVIIPAFSLFIAIITVISSSYVQYTNNQNQTSLRQYEVELKPKQEGYVNYMKAISQSFFFAQANISRNMIQSLNDAENSYYILEPFLSLENREKIWSQYQQFSHLCYAVAQSDSTRTSPLKAYDSLSWYKNFFRTNLYEALFSANAK